MKKSNDTEVMDLILQSLDKIDTKIDRLDERLDNAEKVAIKQEANLDLHMKRSDLLEQSQNKLEDAVKPILKIYTVAWGVTRIVVGLSICVGVVVGIMKLAGKIS